MKNFLIPDWPAPANIKAFTTTRASGASEGPYASFNIATHVNDDNQRVLQNRAYLKRALNLPAEPMWLDQVHGMHAVNGAEVPSENSSSIDHALIKADASFCYDTDRVCVVMTADCLPVLICNRQGTKVAAVHAGWRGLQAGVIENTIDALQENPADLLIWLGPAIGPRAFEVGDEVRLAFVNDMPDTAQAFEASKPGHWLADIYLLARIRLRQKGVNEIYGGGLCTYTDSSRFYSYRHDGDTGRMASLIRRET